MTYFSSATLTEIFLPEGFDGTLFSTKMRNYACNTSGDFNANNGMSCAQKLLHKMIILSKEQVLKLHASLIKATGGSDGIRDEGMLDLALNNPFPKRS